MVDDELVFGSMFDQVIVYDGFDVYFEVYQTYPRVEEPQMMLGSNVAFQQFSHSSTNEACLTFFGGQDFSIAGCWDPW